MPVESKKSKNAQFEEESPEEIAELVDNSNETEKIVASEKINRNETRTENRNENRNRQNRFNKQKNFNKNHFETSENRQNKKFKHNRPRRFGDYKK